MKSATLKKNSAWDQSEIEEFLSSAVMPMRLAVNDKNGFPRICSLWFGYDGERIIGVTHEKSFIADLIKQDGRCAFEVATNTEPYMGVRGQATVTLDKAQGKTALPELIEKYIDIRHPDLQEWLMSRIDEEYALCLDIEWISAWDYTDRMLT